MPESRGRIAQVARSRFSHLRNVGRPRASFLADRSCLVAKGRVTGRREWVIATAFIAGNHYEERAGFPEGDVYQFSVREDVPDQIDRLIRHDLSGLDLGVSAPAT